MSTRGKNGSLFLLLVDESEVTPLGPPFQGVATRLKRQIGAFLGFIGFRFTRRIDEVPGSLGIVGLRGCAASSAPY